MPRDPCAPPPKRAPGRHRGGHHHHRPGHAHLKSGHAAKASATAATRTGCGLETPAQAGMAGLPTTASAAASAAAAGPGAGAIAVGILGTVTLGGAGAVFIAGWGTPPPPGGFRLPPPRGGGDPGGPTPVPEPASLAIFLAACAALLLARACRPRRA